MKRILVSAVLFAGAVALVLAPVVAGGAYPSAATTSSTVIGAVMAIAAVGLAYGTLEFWSCVALGIGAWSFVAPVLFGFYGSNSGFWLHMIAGFISMLTGVAGHELLARQHRPRRGERQPLAPARG